MKNGIRRCDCEPNPCDIGREHHHIESSARRKLLNRLDAAAANPRSGGTGLAVDDLHIEPKLCIEDPLQDVLHINVNREDQHLLALRPDLAQLSQK